MRLTLGRLVRYVLAESDLPETHKNCAGQTIVALVVGLDEDGNCTLTGFPDFKRQGLLPAISLPNRPCSWPPTVGAWHWPPDVHSKWLQDKQRKEAYKAKAKAKAQPAVCEDQAATT